MGSISFPDVREDMHSKDGFLTWVLYHPGKKQFFGYASRTVCYGWTDEPVVTCMGITCVSPITERYAECLLAEVRQCRWWDNDVFALEVRRVRMIPKPEDRNYCSWQFE